MPIRVQCDFCNKVYRLRDEQAGRSVLCKECGAQIRVPSGEAVEDDFTASSPARSATESGDDEWERSFGPGSASGRALPPRRVGVKKAARSSIPVVWLFVGGAVGLVFFVGAFIAVATLVMHGKGKEVVRQDAVPMPVVPQKDRPQPFELPRVAPPPRLGPGNLPAPGAPGQPQAPGFNPQANPAPQPGPAAGAAVQPRPKPQGFIPAPANQQPAPPADWKVVVNPPAEMPALEEGRKVRTVIPKNSNGEIVYPDVTSTYVAVGSNNNEREVREIRDLRNNRKVGQIKGARLTGAKVALSPDGRHFAAWMFAEKGILVWDVRAEKILGKLSFDDGFLKVLAFAGPERLIATGHSGSLLVWNIPSGNPERTIELGTFMKDQTIALSPGGRYLTIIDGDFQHAGIKAWDLSTGETAGEIPLDSLAQKGNDCRAMEFSPDGQELAGLFEGGGEVTLRVWNFADGQLATEIEFPGELRNRFAASGGRDRKIEWFPDKSRWLVYGTGLIDRASARLVWTMPDSEKPDRLAAMRRVIDNDHVLVVAAEKNEAAIIAYELPRDEIARSSEIIGAGGLAIDARLPKLTAADWSQAVALTVTGPAPRWQVSPDPPAGGERELLEAPLQLKSTTGTLRVAMLSNPRSARGVVAYALDNVPARAASARSGGAKKAASQAAPVWLDVFDVAASKSISTVEIPYRCDLAAVSPDGTRALVRLADGESRLDVWSLDTAEHLFGWRPYQVEKEPERKIKAAVFVDATHVLTLNSADKLALWDLETGRALYYIEKVSRAGVSPNRRFLAVSSGAGFRLLDALTGEARGDLAAGGTPGAAGFDHRGERFAVTVSDGAGHRLVAWNLADGRVEHEFPIPTAATSLHWCGDKHVLLDNTSLVDLAHKMLVWRYQLPMGVHISDSPDGRHWYLASPAQRNSGIYLAALALPDAQASSQLATATLKPVMVIEPGSRVGLEVNIAVNPPGKAVFSQEVRQRLTENLAKNKISVAAGGGATVHVAMTHANTGKTNEFRLNSFGPGAGGGPRTVTVAEQKVECSVWVVVPGNKTVWQSKVAFTNDFFGIEFVQQGKSIEQHLLERMWTSATNFLLNFMLPAHVFPDEAVNGLGTSVLSADGATPISSR